MKMKKIMDKDSAHSAILTSLIKALSECDNDTEAHVKRTQAMGHKFAERLNLSDNEISQLELLCVLHDIGKIGIPLEILNKPGKLNEEEWAIMKTHVDKGYSIANSSSEFASIADFILHHHERWDGNGYPAGLSKESIPLLSRIISVIDAFDAMINERPYSKAMSVTSAKEELLKSGGNQFDPNIVSEFVSMLNEDKELCEEIESEKVSDSSSANLLSGTIDSSVLYSDKDQVSFTTPITYTCYHLNKEMRIIKADDNFAKITGYTLEYIKETPLHQIDLIPEEDRVQYLLLLESQMANSTTVYFEHRLRRKDDSIIYVFCIGRIYFDSAAGETRSEIIVCDSASTKAFYLNNLAEQAKLQSQREKWEEAFRKDSMTGLLTHGAFVDDVQELLLSGNKVALLLMDVDFFKTFNDTYGHHEGDRLLIELSNSLAKSVASEKDLVGRLGGDEFAACILIDKDLSEHEAELKVEKVFKEVTASVQSINEEYGISMGIAFSNDEIALFRNLYEVADRALYKAKELGRGQLYYSNRHISSNKF